jgi:hypothetical protein
MHQATTRIHTKGVMPMVLMNIRCLQHFGEQRRDGRTGRDHDNEELLCGFSKGW